MKMIQVLVLLYEVNSGHVRFAHGNADQDLDYSAMKKKCKKDKKFMMTTAGARSFFKDIMGTLFI